MNAKDRKRLKELQERMAVVAAELSRLLEEVEEMAEKEQEKFDNMAEGLQSSERGQKIEAAANGLDAIASLLESAREAVDEAACSEVDE